MKLRKNDKNILKEFSKKLPNVLGVRVVGKSVLGSELKKMHDNQQVRLGFDPKTIVEDIYYKVKRPETYYINHFKEMEKRWKREGMQVLITYPEYLKEFQKRLQKKYPEFFKVSLESESVKPQLQIPEMEKYQLGSEVS